MTTQDLKTQLDEATDRPTAFVPDLDHLLAAGRRRARSHFAVTVAGTVAAVAVAATAGAIALDQGGSSGPSVLPAPPPAGQATSSATVPKLVTKCLDEAGQPAPKGADKWQPMVSVKNKYGSSAVRRSAGQLAFCIEFSGKPTNATRQVLLPKASVWLIPACKTDPTCTELMTVFMGQLPAKAVRVTVTPSGDGKPVDATIRDGFFACHWVTVPDPSRPAMARIYDAAGRELGHYRV
ncbi:hypothetical protein EV138_4898 [Kribbella voronezhensis]|uniref:Uncharacterized protein n=1 Tax=Kribbella voronezhensis TaxID=2512212 RepID=A0A4R7TGF9_9ACTN|nr:hypothetical protein [Kribbella voronezhensis]TDU91294.1 hypothetical protein EV138_4898 [Kribbella voronezhensis]